MPIQLKIKGGDPMSSDMCKVLAGIGVNVLFGAIDMINTIVRRES